MTWTPPQTWPAGHTVNAADMNTYVRDNEKALIATCRAVFLTAGGSFPASASSALGFAGVTHDALGMWSAGAVTRITVLIAGWYTCKGRVGGSSSTPTLIEIRKNGATILVQGAAGTGNLFVGDVDLDLAASDYLELVAVTGTGAYTLAANLGCSSLTGDLSVQWVGP